MPELLAEKLKAPSVEAGTYDLVIHPSNLWLTIHESIGHATELDRALGYEANYAGTSFATYDKLGTLQYGSPVMNVTGRPHAVEHGLATVGYDDEGVRTQAWDIVRDGVLVGYQLDRSMGHLKPELNDGRSNGCAYADSSGHIPIQRMANVSLQPGRRRTSHRGADLPRGARASTSSATSPGRSTCSASTSSSPASGSTGSATASSPGMLRDVAYQATTTDFWGSMEAVGGPDTWVLGGAFNCGKAQPGQVAAVSHGCPTVALPWRQHPQHHRRGGPLMTSLRSTPQQLVEHALASSTADDCVAIVRDVTSANLRWANNTLTTNGVMTGVSVTVVSFAAVQGGVATGSVSGSASTPEQVTALVRGRRRGRSGRIARGGRGRAGRGVPPRRTGTTEPETTDIGVYDAFAPALGEAFARADAEDRLLYGFVNHERRHDLPRVDAAASGCATSSRPGTTPAPARTPRSRGAPGSAARPATSATSTPPRWPRPRPAPRAGPSAASTCPPGATTPSCRRRPSPT